MKISIVTPSLNQGQYIEETICSVINQSYNNFEYFIFDGGSTDNTIEIIKNYETKITYWESILDRGQSDALINGFSRCSGDIWGWINADDYYCPSTFHRVSKFFKKNPKISFVNGDVNFIDKDGNLIERIFSISPDWRISANLGVHRWPQPSCFWRKSHYVAIGGIDSSLQFAMDMDLFIRLAKYGKSNRIPGKPLANFRVHNESKSSRIHHIGLAELHEIRKKYKTDYKLLQEDMLKIKWWFCCKHASLRKFASQCFNIEF